MGRNNFQAKESPDLVAEKGAAILGALNVNELKDKNKLPPISHTGSQRDNSFLHPFEGNILIENLD